MRAWTVAAAAWMGCVCIWGQAMDGPAPANLVANGDFEALTGDWAAPWSRPAGAAIVAEAGNRYLLLDGGGVSVSQRLPLRPEWWKLRLTMRMRVADVVRGDEGWKDGRLAMSFHAEDGTRVGNWPNVFSAAGTTDWVDCDRVYAVPRGAAYLTLNPANFGTQGRVSFDDIRLAVVAERAAGKSDAPLPDGFVGDPWDAGAAAGVSTATQGRLCINGLWRFRPVVAAEDAGSIPAVGDCWGWFKVPGIWPGVAWDLGTTAQEVHLAPWLDEDIDLRRLEQAWYKRRLQVPAAWEGRRIRLVFTMLQTHAAVYVDGRPAGELWFPGGDLDLTAAVRPGADHEVAILVTAKPMATDRNDFMAPDRIIRSQASVKLKGITGDLFLESAPRQDAIRDVQVRAVPTANTMAFDVGVADASRTAYRLRVAIHQDRTRLRTFELPVSPLRGGRLTVAAPPWHEAPLWDIDTPTMLTATVSLLGEDGAVLDEALPVRFGHRDFTFSGRDFLLNGIPIHLRALHNTSTNGYADKGSVEGARRTVARMQEYGFNFLIVGNYNFSPGEVGYLDGLLEACDEMGMLASVSLPHVKDFDWKLDDDATAARYRILAEWIVRRVQNHPSVVMYGMTHNATGYYGDQNPLKIDGIYDPDAIAASLEYKGDPNRSRRRAQALLAQDIARSIDPGRPIYHHQSGNLGDMHTVNIYLNWAPPQERSDWLAHWGTVGTKPLFFVEWGLPHISSWSSYRGPEFIWRCLAFQSLWVSEFAAAHLGAKAYAANPGLREALDFEEDLWRRGAPFAWSQLAGKLRAVDSMHVAVMALFAADNWRSHRAWGISAMLPWDQGQIWDRVRPTPGAANPQRFANLQRPGIVPDAFTPGGQTISDPGPDANFAPSALGLVFQRWNAPLCAFIGGDPSGHGPEGPSEASDRRFTEKRHTVLPGEAVSKSLVILNDTRRQRTCAYRWFLGEPGAGASGAGEVVVPAAGRAFVPLSLQIPADAAAGSLPLTARFGFAQGETQQDTFLFTVLPTAAVARPQRPVKLLDPAGQTGAFLDRLGIAHQPCAPDGAGVGASDVVVVGELALSRPELADRDLPVFRLAPSGTRFLVLAQAPEVLTHRLGFRVNVHGLRQLWVRTPDHPALAGCADAHMANWAGSSGVVPPFLDTPPIEASDPRWDWCGFRNTRVWRAGNLGSVASVLIEKPSRGDWLPLLDGGFDLQYAPLLETTTGTGRVVFCQLDLVHRSIPEVVAERLARQILRYLETVQGPAVRRVVYRGDARGANLLRDLGVAFEPCPEILPRPAQTLIVAGPGSRPPAGIAAAVEAGTAVLSMGLEAESLAAWFPELGGGETRAVLSAGWEGMTDDPLLRGVSPADLHWRTRPTIAALPGEGHPAVRVLRRGRGVVVLCQAPPWVFDQEAQPYLRTTWRRATFVVSRLLANLGAGASHPLAESLARRAPEFEAALPAAWTGIADPQGVGREAGWWKPDSAAAAWPAIAVPGTFEAQRPELASYDGLFWYRLQFAAADAFTGDDATLFLGAIDDESWVWLNGTFLGEVTKATHPENYWSFPRSYALPGGLLRPAGNVLVVLVNDTYQTGGIQGTPRLHRPAPWLQSVYLQTPQAGDDPYRYYRW